MMRDAAARRETPFRTWLLAFLVLVLVDLLAGTALAQQSSPTAPPPKAQQLLQLLEDPEVKSWLEGKGAAAAPSSSTSMADTISGWEASTRARLDGMAGAVLRLRLATIRPQRGPS